MLARAGVDVLLPLTMTSLPETVGIVRAAERAGLPVLVSPTIEPDGQPARRDAAGRLRRHGRPADVRHPGRLHGQLRSPEPPRPGAAPPPPRAGAPWLARFRGMRANASTKTHAELDNSTALDRGDPAALARGVGGAAAGLPADDRGRVLWDGRGASGGYRGCVSVRGRGRGRGRCEHAQAVLLAGAGAAAGGRRGARVPDVRSARVRERGVHGAGGAGAARPRQAHLARARPPPAAGLPGGDRGAAGVAGPRTRDRRAAGRRHGAVLLSAAHAVRRRARPRSLRRVDARAIRADQTLQRRSRASGPTSPRDPERTFAVLRRWTADRNAHVRRLVSEGTRLRLPWAARVAWLDAHPDRVLELLELLKDDPSTLVRRSVANNLNDLGKLHPDLLRRTCARWLRRRLRRAPRAGRARAAQRREARRRGRAAAARLRRQAGGRGRGRPLRPGARRRSAGASR